MTLTVNFNTTFSTLNRLATDPLAPWLKYVAISEKKKVEERIKSTKVDPDGHAWEPWAPSTEAYRRKHGTEESGLLLDSGALLASFVAKSNTNSATISSEGIPYAGWLQHGTNHMPARPYLGWSTVSLATLELEAAVFLAKIK